MSFGSIIKYIESSYFFKRMGHDMLQTGSVQHNGQWNESTSVLHPLKEKRRLFWVLTTLRNSTCAKTSLGYDTKPCKCPVMPRRIKNNPVSPEKGGAEYEVLH